MAKSVKKKAAFLSGKLPIKSLRKPSGKSKKAGIRDAAEPLADSDAAVLDRLFAVVESRRGADPMISHSARLLSRGPAKVAQKFGEEAVECLIEAVAGNRDALIAESADVLYHLLVLWVSAGISAADVWTELNRREGISGIAEKAARANLPGTSKIP
ncbi:MAG TPA: phosphoribosyl-ATP diphosphatase [Rhodopila sp.]|jgi:phosphoribosyl-ATP pyrophosphohydrolase